MPREREPLKPITKPLDWDAVPRWANGSANGAGDDREMQQAKQQDLYSSIASMKARVAALKGGAR